MNARDKIRLADQRHHATSEEREVLALEMIADGLAVIGSDLSKFGDALTTGTFVLGPGRDSEPRGALAEPELIDAPEIKRTLVPHYAVGGFSYTNLAHAIAEAKRARRLGRS